tara:strand:- start:223 stop:711 length:489 start_codon:yes stop_codon:yes gene_type:complete
MAAYEAHGESDEWYTPKYIFDALGCGFDLDVAAPLGGPRYVPADSYMTQEDDALLAEWCGFVWMNPPFGNQNTKRRWLNKFFQHGCGIALVPDRTSAPWFQEMATMADAMCFLNGKVKFERPDGSIGKSPGTGTVLVASGARASEILENSNLGFWVSLKHVN